MRTSTSRRSGGSPQGTGPTRDATSANSVSARVCGKPCGPHQKCRMCEEMKPLKDFQMPAQEKDGKPQRVRHNTHACTQCKSEKKKTCAECKAEKGISAFAAYSQSTRCKDCQFPSCAVCEHKRLPSEGAVRLDHKVAATGQANAVRIWYCAKSLCQTKKASEKICDECSQRKPQNEEHWRRRDEDGCERYVARCLECEFPPCSNCGGKPKHAVLQTERADGAWYCSHSEYMDDHGQTDGRTDGRGRGRG